MAEFARSLAIVIGINQYGNGISMLQTAVNDAKAIARILEQEHKYKVRLLLDQAASLQALQQILDQELTRYIHPDDRLLFYFAGHGIALNGEDGPEGFLIPQDAKLGDTKSYLPMAKLQAALSDLPCRHFLGILDCCFAGAFRWSSTRKLVPVELGIIHKERFDRFIQDPAWQIITSAASDQTALDAFDLKSERVQAGHHSPFAATLIEALSGQADLYPPAAPGKPAGDGVTTATELYLYLRDRIETATAAVHHRQTPEIWPLKKHDKGEYIFLTPGHVLNLPPAPPLDESRNPYRGLQSFEAEQSDLFFGRQTLTVKLGEFVRRQPLTVVLGASGSGKSSLVKAGLIPHLKQQDLQATQPQWQILAPLRPGESPFNALINALDQENVSGFSAPEAGSAAEPEMLTQYMAAWSQQHPGMTLLLAIDQFEELITLCRDEKQREQFLSGLAQAVTAYPKQLRLVLTLRSDFEPQFQDTVLKDYWSAARFVVPPMTRSELRDAIEEPASKRVMYFESDDPKHPLIDQLIDEVAEMPGALPLLSFTLSELYLKYLHRQRIAQDRGDSLDRAIIEADYKALGGVARSLTQRADQEYEALVKQDPEYAKTIQNVMLRMVVVGGGELARRQVPLAEFEYPLAQNDRVKAVIQHFSAARLVVEGQDSNGKPYAEPAHDALVRGWQKLLTWKQEQEESLILQRRLTPAAEEWKQVTQQKQATDLLAKAKPAIDWLDRGFYTVENLLSKVSAQVARQWQRSQQQQERSREKAGQFLWNTNPYLDVLYQQLQSNHNWFNQVESEFVQESVLQRRQNTSWRWRIATGVILGLSGLTIAALIGQRNAQIGQTRASTESAEANFRANEQLDALVASLRAGKNVKQIRLPDNALHNQVGQTLRNMVYGAKESNRWDAPPGIVFSIFFTSDQLRIITNENGAVRLWNIDGKMLAELQGQEGLKRGGISISPDGSKIATATQDGAVRLWDLQGNKLTEFQAHLQALQSASYSTPAIRYISFNPDGNTIATNGEDGAIRLWDLQGNKKGDFQVSAEQSIIGLGFNSSGNLLISILGGDRISVHKLLGNEFQELAASKTGYGTSLIELSFGPDGKQAMVFYGEESENAALWNFSEKSEPQNISENINDRISRGGSFSLNGDRLAAMGVDGAVNLLNGNGAPTTTFKLPQGRVKMSTFSPDGNQLVTLGDDNTIRLWDLEQQPLFKSKLAQSGIKSISFSPDGRTIATADSEGIIRLLDLQGKQIKEFTEHPKATSVSFSPDGQTIATTGDSGMVRLLDLQGNPINKFQAHPGKVTSVSWSQDSQKIATIGDGGAEPIDGSIDQSSARIWNTQGNQLKEDKGNIVSEFQSIAFKSDGSPIGVSKGTVNQSFGNIDSSDLSGRLTNIIPGRQGGNVFNSVKVSQDGSLLLTISDNTLRLWNLKGEKLMEFSGDKDSNHPIKSLSLSPDNSMLAVIRENGTTELWQLGEFDELLAKGCNRVRDYLKHNPHVSESDRHLCDT